MGKKLLVCAGSIGQPRDGDRRASYMVFDDQLLEFRYYRIPYNLNLVINDFEDMRIEFPQHNDIIDDSIERLRQGI